MIGSIATKLTGDSSCKSVEFGLVHCIGVGRRRRREKCFIGGSRQAAGTGAARSTAARRAARRTKGYARVTEPHGWNTRPTTVDRGAYQHNFQAARRYPRTLSAPAGLDVTPLGVRRDPAAAYWAPQYLIADYWLFALEVPPAGYEWVRDGNDALLIDTSTGEILQVEYGVFA